MQKRASCNWFLKINTHLALHFGEPYILILAPLADILFGLSQQVLQNDKNA